MYKSSAARCRNQALALSRTHAGTVVKESKSGNESETRNEMKKKEDEESANMIM